MKYKCNGKPKKSLLGVIVDISMDFENGEHVDDSWVKDSFELAGYTLVSNEHYWDLQNKILELEEQIKER